MVRLTAPLFIPGLSPYVVRRVGTIYRNVFPLADTVSNSLPDSLPDFLFIAVHIGRVYEPDSAFQGRIHGIEACLSMQGIGADSGRRQGQAIVHDKGGS